MDKCCAIHDVQPLAPMTSVSITDTTPLKVRTNIGAYGSVSGMTNTPHKMIISNTTQNLLVLYELEHLRLLSNVNLWLCIFSLLYVAVNVTGLNWNRQSQVYRDIHEVPMHLLEFWATLVFALVQVLALVYTPKSLTSITRGASTCFLKVVVFMNVGTAATAAILYTLDPDRNEVISHETEYSNELLMSFIDFIFLRGLLPQLRRDKEKSDDLADLAWGDEFSTLFLLLACMFTTAQLFVYNALPNGEQNGHWMEYSFGVIVGCVSFWFCMDNKFLADERIEVIICGCNTGHHTGI